MAVSIGVEFVGRLSGALGVCYPITDQAVVENPNDLDSVRLALYTGNTASGKAYEHVLKIKLVECEQFDGVFEFN
ncbi:MAG: hypothetical protein ACRDCE_09475 [Cetobacterium sp.]|uniref:hypothetical protein n=1 Tax=Cetobacterium sp. TaxID=2071632 RepID=UPI003EE6CC33